MVIKQLLKDQTHYKKRNTPMKQLFTFLAAVLLTATTYAQVESPSQKETLSTVGLKTGVYILKVQAENIVFTKKLLIE